LRIVLRLVGSTRYFLVTTARVLVHRNGMFGNERGAYVPGEMKSMRFTRAFLGLSGGGNVTFSQYTTSTSRSSTIYVKGLLSITKVNAAAKAIHDALLWITDDEDHEDEQDGTSGEGRREAAFRKRDDTKRILMVNSLLIGGLFFILFA